MIGAASFPSDPSHLMVSSRCSRTLPISPVDLIACLIDEIRPPSQGLGHPPTPTTDVVATLGFFLPEEVQWRELRAAPGRVSGATLRRRLAAWTSTGVLHQVHAYLIRRVRGGPHGISAPGDVVVDRCSVRAKRGGDLVDPTDRGKPGTTTSSAGSIAKRSMARRSLLSHRR